MKNLLKIICLSLFISFNSYAQKKITASEDVFIQGGETSGEDFGTTDASILRIGNSDQDSKYARIVYLKFRMPKKIDEIKSVSLVLNIKVFKRDMYKGQNFNMNIYGVENDYWKESSITWDDALELGDKVGSKIIPQSETQKNSKIEIKLDIESLKKYFNGKKDRNLTLAIGGYDTKLSAVMPSKDKSSKFGPTLIIK